jgi:hypothetical protein
MNTQKYRDITSSRNSSGFTHPAHWHSPVLALLLRGFSLQKLEIFRFTENNQEKRPD